MGMGTSSGLRRETVAQAPGIAAPVVAWRAHQLVGPVPMDPQLPATEITALLGRGTHFEGKLHFEGRVRIDGTFKGEIRSDDTLIIGEGAEIGRASCRERV